MKSSSDQSKDELTPDDKRLLQFTPEIEELVESSDLVVEIRDMESWTSLRRNLGYRENLYFIGTTANLVDARLRMWVRGRAEEMQLSCDAIEGTDEYESVHRGLLRDNPVERRFRAFVYAPFDNGASVYHEGMHVAQRIRAARGNVPVKGLGLYNGAEAVHVRGLEAAIGNLQRDSIRTAVYTAFVLVRCAIRRYPQGDLSREFFAWVCALAECPNYFTWLKGLTRLTQREMEYLHNYLSEDRKRRTTAMIGPVRRFNDVAGDVPEIAGLLRSYCEQLDEAVADVEGLDVQTPMAFAQPSD